MPITQWGLTSPVFKGVSPGSFKVKKRIVTHILFQLCGENRTYYHDKGAKYCCIKNELDEELERGLRHHAPNP
jgi:hypothetical protein